MCLVYSLPFFFPVQYFEAHAILLQVATISLLVGEKFGYSRRVIHEIFQCFDFLITLPDEVCIYLESATCTRVSKHFQIQMIWPSKLTTVKVLFFLNRYLPFVVAILGLYCMSYLSYTLLIQYLTFD